MLLVIAKAKTAINNMLMSSGQPTYGTKNPSGWWKTTKKNKTNNISIRQLLKVNQFLMEPKLVPGVCNISIRGEVKEAYVVFGTENKFTFATLKIH